MQKLFSKKQQGMTLIEFVLAFALGSIISLMLYRIFITTQKSSVVLRNANTLQSIRSLVTFHLQRDFQGFLLPLYFVSWYHTCNALKKENKEASPSGAQKDTIKDRNAAESTKKSDKDKEQQEEAKKKLEVLKQFLPSYEEKDGSLIIAIPTSRSLLTSGISPCRTKVIYKFKGSNKQGEKSIYSLIRSEEPFELATEKKQTSEAKKPSEYVLIERIENPEIIWYMPQIDLKKLEAHPDKNQKENKDKDSEKFLEVLAEWQQKPVFTHQKELKMPTPEDYLKTPFIPCGFSLQGTIISADGNRKLPIAIAVEFPNAYYTLFKWLLMYSVDQEEKKKENKDTPGSGDSSGN